MSLSPCEDAPVGLVPATASTASSSGPALARLGPRKRLGSRVRADSRHSLAAWLSWVAGCDVHHGDQPAPSLAIRPVVPPSWQTPRSMSDSSPIEDIASVVVTGADGTMFHCEPAYFVADTADLPNEPRLRWSVLVSDGSNHIGPAIQWDRSPEAVQRSISAWWATKSGRNG